MSEDLKDLPILICANKQDLVDVIDPNSLYTMLKPVVENNRINHEVNFQPTSSLTCEGIKQSILWLITAASKTQRAINHRPL